MSDNEKKMLQSLRKGLMRRGIPTYVSLAFIDIACKEVGEDLTKVYYSVLVKDLVLKTSKMLLNLPISNILPVVNYKHQTELDNNMDILLLNAFSRLIGAKERKFKKMKCKIADAAPVTTSGVVLPYYNIFILGQIGSGKSTFFNGINAILTNRMLTTKAEAGEMAFSLTKEFRMYEIKAPGEEKVSSTRICDTFGLKQNADDDTDVRNVLSAINGHVPDKHFFTDDEFHQDSPGYIALPTLENRAHCVGIVIDAQKVSIM
ncbi:interferon-induced protein 44-like, partial [Actinia tenebrosa]|uniref:Interferon-induced protein 44-like n=1 Tax=Actinia tenebrosa TaxID=6105 RepID=A0A6P8J5U7_ACTTE